jgi:hypothetical protein
MAPNVPDHGFARGNEDGAKTNMAAEDAEFLEAMLCQMFLIMVSLEEMKMAPKLIWLRKMQNF